MPTTTLLAVFAVLVLLTSNARADSLERPPPMKRSLLAGPSQAPSERPPVSLNLPGWVLESFSHPGWQPLWTTTRGGGVGSFFSCGMVWLTLRNSSWSFRAGTCPPGT